MTRASWLRRSAVTAAVAAVLVPLLPIGQAAADTAPPVTATPPTVSADVLPTVQINGVVWAQMVVGNTVYATGEFTSARPAGSPAGTNEVPRGHVLAYDIRTGELLPGFAPTLNAQGRALAASPDGQTIYIGGSFTEVGGVRRNRVAAVDATSGALRNLFTTGTDARVNALALSGDTLHIGGIFNTAGGQARTRLAAYSTTTGALLPWAPSADAEVLAMVAPPGAGKVVVGGRFANLNGAANYGLGALDPATAAVVPFAVNAIVRNAGNDAAIYSLTTNGPQVFGTGYTFGPGGNLENTFSADAGSGALTWVSGCTGDTYSAAALGDVVYTAGHAHNCSQIGNFPEQNPRTWQRAVAYRTAPAPDGRLNVGGSFLNRPAPELLHWQPSLAAGGYTGQTQAAWSVAGNAQYVLLGGEFPSINGVDQQGLARFAIKDVAPNREGAQGTATLSPTFTAVGPGTVRANFGAVWDRDNTRLTYELLRGPQLSTATVVGSTSIDSAWWNRPGGALTDSGAPPGSSQSYRVRVKDPFGNIAVGPTVTATVPPDAATTGTYRDAVLADSPVSYWRLGEPSGTTGYNWRGSTDLTLASNAQRNTPGAVPGDTDAATTFPGTTGVPASTTGTAQPGPQTFSVEAWFKSTSTTGGKIVGFGNRNNAASSLYDRQIYLSNSGQVVFGVAPGGAVRTVASPSGFNNGQWHHVVGTLSDAGLRLYVDGQSVANRADTISAQVFNGYWRVGGDAFGSSWPSRPSSANLAGSIDEVAIYPNALPAARVLDHSERGRGIVPNQPPTSAFTQTVTDLAVAFDGSGSTDADGTVVTYAWDFGDGQTGTGATAQHTYATPGTRTVTLTVTDDDGATAVTSHPVTTTPANQAPTAAFTATATNLAVAFDGGGSTDADGSVATYAWNFGDGQTGSGATAQHTYATPGTWTVTLIVTDDDGATATTSQSVTTTPVPAGGPVANDAFERTVASGLGSADLGGAWTVLGTGGTTAVAAGSAQVTVNAGKTLTLRLPSVAHQDNDVVHKVWLEQVPTGGGATLSTTVRSTAAGDYRARVRVLATGEVQASLTRVSGATETTVSPAVTVSGLTYAAGTQLMVRVQAIGASPTTVQMKVWAAGTAEPSAWQRTATDGTAGLQQAGSVGLVEYLSGSATAAVVVRHDDLRVVRP